MNNISLRSPRNLPVIVFCIFIWILVLNSCKLDKESTGNSKATPKTENKTAPKKRSTTKNNNSQSEDSQVSSKSASADLSKANSKIDPQRIDLILLEELLHREINKVRNANKLPTLVRNTVLQNAAIDQNQYVVKNEDLTHYQKSAKKKTIKDRVKFHGGGFQAMAENLIYEGFTVRTVNGVQAEIITTTYQQLVKTMTKNWLNSPGHRANIMEGGVDKVGTAIAYNPNNHAVYATQVFGKLW